MLKARCSFALLVLVGGCATSKCEEDRVVKREQGTQSMKSTSDLWNLVEIIADRSVPLNRRLALWEWLGRELYDHPRLDGLDGLVEGTGDIRPVCSSAMWSCAPDVGPPRKSSRTTINVSDVCTDLIESLLAFPRRRGARTFLERCYDGSWREWLAKNRGRTVTELRDEVQKYNEENNEGTDY